MFRWQNTQSTCNLVRSQTIADLYRLSAPLDPEDRERLIDALATWDFKPHRLNEGDLYRVACLIFHAVLHIEGVKELALDRGKSTSAAIRLLADRF